MSRNLFLAIILLIASSFFWSGNFFSGKLAFLSDLTPFKLSFFRWILALLILLPFTYAQIIKDLKMFRTRVMILKPRTCYTYHKDTTKRIKMITTKNIENDTNTSSYWYKIQTIKRMQFYKLVKKIQRTQLRSIW